MKKIIIAFVCGVALSTAADTTREVCLPNSAVVGMPADAALTLVQTNTPSHAVRPVAMQVLVTSNRNTAVTATYRVADVTYEDVKQAVARLLRRVPDAENANSAHWTVKTDGQVQVTASTSTQSGRIKMSFAEHPVMKKEQEDTEPEH
jgi:hypothetical protein